MGDGPKTVEAKLPLGGGPPDVPGSGPPAMPGGPPAMPSGPPAMPGGPPAIPSGPSEFGTIQMRAGEVFDQPPSIMPTLTGSDLPHVVPPSVPPARYQLAHEIARGGMGRVVEAIDTVLGRVVALKEALSFDADSIRRFQRETKITARLEHPSIVPVHDAGSTSEGMPYYVMRKISGRPLEQLVASAGSVEERLALVQHLVQASQAIAHAHVRGIVHRDIKASNILVGDLGETIVIDWGLAKVIGEVDDVIEEGATPTVPADDVIKTRAGIVFGTPGFMAPEQLRGDPADERFDVYALGATLYHVLSGKPPHHAKTADAMMLAAVTGPPTPIGELVTGVPPELATIIDKALHHDPELRYRDARFLAEDLNQFVTGQLVASHHYTPRERVIRFAKQHKVPIGISVAALLAIAIGGTVAVNRVVNERDRADESARIAVAEKRQAEHERAIAIERADQISLTQARILVETNPALAVALLRPLAAKHWREVRGIAAAARATGVPWSIAVSPHTTSVELARDGQHALIAGSDGVVRVVDLAKRTAQTVTERHVSARARYADDDHRVIVFHDTKLAIIDTTTRARREVELPSAIADLEVVGVTAYWVDADHKVWKLDLAGSEPVELPLDEPINALAPSPDGHWIALAGEQHLLVHDRTQPTLPPTEITFGETKDATWSADSAHLAALVDQNVIDVAMVSGPSISQRLNVGNRFGVAFTNDKLYTVGPTGVGFVTYGTSTLRKQLPGSSLGLREARGGTLVTAGTPGTIHAISDDGDNVLNIPTLGVEAIDASPRSPYVIASIAGRLLVWNLDDIQPRRVTTAAPAAAGFVGSDQVIAAFVDAPAEWIDLVTHRATGLGAMPAVRSVIASPDGQLAMVIDLTHHARLVSASDAAVEVAGDVDRAGFLDDHRLVVASSRGLGIYDVTTRAERPLDAPKLPLLGLAWTRPGWIAAAYDDKSLWRLPVATGKAQTTKLAARPTSPPIVLANGTVLIATGADLQAWRPDGTLVVHSTLPKPIAELAAAGPSTAIAFDSDGMTYLVDLAAPSVATPAYALSSSAASMAADGGLLVALDRGGGVELVDPLVKQHWILARASSAAYAYPQMSADGKRVLAMTPKHLLVWTLALPTTAAETVTWLDAITNAHAATDNELTWR